MKALALSVLLVATGCSATSPYMKQMDAHVAPVAKPDSATVVFVRHTGFANSIKSTVVDEQGHFIGDTLPTSYFARDLPPGKHMFVVWAENTDFLSAELAAGKVYYVEVDPAFGAFSARMHLFAVKPGSKDWDKLNGWLAENKQFQVDVQGGEAYLQGRAADVQERIKRANEHMAESKGDDLDRRTLKATDAR